jgi:hypothetical protein
MEEAVTTKTARPRRKLPMPPPLERVCLAHEHKHLGVLRASGTEIEVHPETARWLRAVGVVSTPEKKE